MKRLFAMIVAVGFASTPASAQLALPGAAPADAPAEPDVKTVKPKRRIHRVAEPAVALAPDPAALLGRTLRLNGRNGELRLEHGQDKAIDVVRYTLLGEVVSNPSQQCRIEIVADKPIEATPKDTPDGLARFSADIPACPITFDVVSDGVIVAPQTNACVFTAADCQASPSGVWGPEAAELDKDAKGISRARDAADRSIQDSLRELEKRDKDAPASLAREQSDFAAERDEICRDYASETRLGFCASRMMQARAALLARRVADAGPARVVAAKRRKRSATR